ncbi:quinolinate synthase NadA [Patescibacteria group bacterium]
MLPEKYKALSDSETFPLIKQAKEKLGDDLFILAHHYQRDEVIQFADAIGDSLMLSQRAAKTSSKYIVFCGVTFMAETADIITDDDQTILHPDLSAGCPMADMAPASQIRKAWKELEEVIGDTSNVIPITYINSYAETKAFCGEHNGVVCTSSNADKILKWALEQDKKVFFFPDQHLGRNTAHKLSITNDQMALWQREKEYGGLGEEELKATKIYLWNGCCPVHERFKYDDLKAIRERDPEIKILVHPEVPEELANDADYMGSTQYIVNMIEEAPAGSKWAIGTEVHLVSRLAKNHPDKQILLIGTPICMCSMMDRISPQYLLWTLESLVNGEVINVVKVPENIAKNAVKALDRMFELT